MIAQPDDWQVIVTPTAPVSLRRDNLLFVTGLLVFISFLLLPRHTGSWSKLDSLRATADLLKGKFTATDIACDFVGFRGLYYGSDPYPVLGVALKKVGIDWNVPAENTHPPTT